MVDASTVAAAADATRVGSLRVRDAIAIMTAVLETNAPTTPRTMSPCFSPTNRVPTKPLKESPQTSTTINQMWKGFRTAHGP